MDTKVVEAVVKTNIVDEGLDVFYDPLFYNKQQALDTWQQLLKTEIVSDNLDTSSFTPDVLSFSSGENQVVNNDDRPVSSFCKEPIDQPWRKILTKIRNDIQKALGISLNLCLADWHKDGHDRNLVARCLDEDIDPGSSIIWMSFGPPRDLLLTASEHPNTLSNIKKPKFLMYKFSLPSGSLLQIKPPINRFWNHELRATANTDISLHISLKFIMNVEEKSFHDVLDNFFNNSSSSNAGSVSECSTISPETAKVARRRRQWGSHDDDWSTVLITPRKCTTPGTSEKTEITRQMSFDRAQSGPLKIQSSADSSRSFFPSRA